MAVLLEQFVETLSDSGLMTREAVQRLLAQLPDDKRPTNGQEIATLLYQRGELTKFQAEAVYRGKAKGLVLGDYLVLDKIGEGGMGQVYKAQHRRMKRIVAVKVLPAEMTKSPEAVRRFQQEVEAAGRLNHPNVVTAFDAGEAKGIHFLAMEYVDGRDLASVVNERGVLPVAEALDYTVQAATGLAYAHGEGVIHRDIKPSNLLLDNKGTVKILDMGLARAETRVAAEAETADRGLTRSGDVMGTVDYMSPEQAASTKHVDPRTDIYSLGATLFYLLNGRPMFTGDTLVERVLAHRDKPVPKLKALRDDVPQALDLAFRRMVGKKPEERFRSMKDVILALEKCEVPKWSGSAGRPAPPSQPVAETSRQTRTMPATSELAAAASGAPPPPALSPRDRTPVRPDPTTRRDRAVREVKALEQQRERKEAWTAAVDAVVRQQDRTARWDRIRRIIRSGVARIATWVLLVTLLGGTAGGGYYVWQNYQRLTASRQQVLTAVNQALSRTDFEPISALDFSDVSIVRPLPQTLSFEHPLFQNSTGARRQTATLKGQFDRAQSTVEILEPFHIRVKVDPAQ
jgi:serine/threonine protein kinase